MFALVNSAAQVKYSVCSKESTARSLDWAVSDSPVHHSPSLRLVGDDGDSETSHKKTTEGGGPVRIPLVVGCGNYLLTTYTPNQWAAIPDDRKEGWEEVKVEHFDASRNDVIQVLQDGTRGYSANLGMDWDRAYARGIVTAEEFEAKEFKTRGK